MSKFDINQLPIAYFSENTNAVELRNQLVKNMVQLPECDINLLTELFFSKKNIELLNKQLILAVWKYSKKKYLIAKQNERSLLIVMRYVWINDAKHLNFNIKEQIKQLNCHVVNYILPNIITNVEQKIGYLRDINRPLQLIDLPENVNKLDRALPSMSEVYHHDIKY